MSKIEYFDLLSPSPIPIQSVGRIRKPTLKEISDSIGIKKYNYYIYLLNLNVEEYVQISGLSEFYSELSEEQKSELTLYNFIINDIELREMFSETFSFFIVENVVFSEDHNVFLVLDEENETVGFINNENYRTVCDYILQSNCVETKQKPKKQIFTSERARELYELQEKRKKNSQKKDDYQKDLELGNMISKLSAYHNNLNPTNIWDLTIFQIYDQFQTVNYMKQINLSEMIYSNHGGEYSPTDWFKNIKD